MTQTPKFLTGELTSFAVTRDDHYNITSTGMEWTIDGAKYRLSFRRDRNISIEVVTSKNITLGNYLFGTTRSDVEMYFIDTSKTPPLRIRVDQGSFNVTKTLSWEGATLPADAGFMGAGAASGFTLKLSDGKLRLKEQTPVQ